MPEKPKTEIPRDEYEDDADVRWQWQQAGIGPAGEWLKPDEDPGTGTPFQPK